MKRKTLNKFFVAAKILIAWSTVDVFVVSIFAALMEFRQFAQYILGGHCDELNKILKVIDELHLLNLHGDDRCFDVVTSLQLGALFLFFSAILFFALSFFVLRVCDKNLSHKDDNKS